MPGLLGEQVDADGRVAAVHAGGLAQPARRRQARLGLDRDVRLEPVLAAVHRLVGVPGLGVHHADDPVRGDALSDPPPRRAAGINTVRVGFDQFDVLTGDQREQPHRVTRRAGRLLTDAVQHRQRVAHQSIDQRVAGRLVIPDDRGLARVVVVMSRRHLSDHDIGPPHQPADPPDRRDQLGNGVLSGDRVIEHGRVQRSTGLALQHPGRGDDLLHSGEDPVRFGAGQQPLTPHRQRRVVERLGRDRPTDRSLPPQVEGHRVGRLRIRQAVQRLQHDDRRHHIRRHRRPSALGGEQVGEHLIRKQPLAVLSQEREHTARPEQMPSHRLGVEQLPLILRSTLHTHIVPPPPRRDRDDAHCSGVS